MPTKWHLFHWGYDNNFINPLATGQVFPAIFRQTKWLPSSSSLGSRLHDFGNETVILEIRFLKKQESPMSLGLWWSCLNYFQLINIFRNQQWNHQPVICVSASFSAGIAPTCPTKLWGSSRLNVWHECCSQIQMFSKWVTKTCNKCTLLENTYKQRVVCLKKT